MPKKLMAELEGFRRNQQFFNMLMYGSPSSINERVKRHIHRARSTFICWHRDSLIQTYGEDIIPYVWELVIVLQGLLRECITLIKLEKEPLALEPLTEFIIRHLNLIVENRTTETALPQEMIDLYIASASSFEPKDKTVLLAESLKELKEAVSAFRRKNMTPQDSLPRRLCWRKNQRTNSRGIFSSKRSSVIWSRPDRCTSRLQPLPC